MDALKQDLVYALIEAAKKFVDIANDSNEKERFEIEKECRDMMKIQVQKLIASPNMDAVWEHRRYEIAKDALCAIISSDNHNEITLDCITAVNIADELIKQLKGGKDEK